jgi:NAD(P) transhydrogenase subunit alpha
MSDMARRVASFVVALLLGALGFWAPSEFIQHFTVFVLACFVGWQVVWNVAPALHTPLMSVTNAISGIIIVGGMLGASTGRLSLGAILSAVAILVASINIAGGFLVTQRMLQMFRREGE